jgi:hypothetical protein
MTLAIRPRWCRDIALVVLQHHHTLLNPRLNSTWITPFSLAHRCATYAAIYTLMQMESPPERMLRELGSYVLRTNIPIGALSAQASRRQVSFSSRQAMWMRLSPSICNVAQSSVASPFLHFSRNCILTRVGRRPQIYFCPFSARLQSSRRIARKCPAPLAKLFVVCQSSALSLQSIGVIALGDLSKLAMISFSSVEQMGQ